jgi:hypothetical protein
MSDHRSVQPSAISGQPRKPQPYAMLAEFATPGDIYHAAEKTRAAGYKWFDCCVPFPVHGLDKAMGVRPTILPVLVFCCGLTGTTVAILLQVLTNATRVEIPMLFLSGYNFLISGKPLISGPAFVPVAFELTVLLAALGSFGLMLILNWLPQLYHPLFKSVKFARATDDRFFLVIEARDPKYQPQRTEEFMRAMNPLSIEVVES